MAEPKHGAAYLDKDALRELFGYLNFSNGKPDPGFQRNFNLIYTSFVAAHPRDSFPGFLLTELETLGARAEVFRDAGQARAVVQIVFERFVPAYRAFHADMLFHLNDEDFFQPFLLARFFEVVLAEGSPWTEVDRIVEGALHQVNDFIGFRPVAVLENDRKVEPYAHEWFRPLPVYLADAGVASGPYQDLIERTLEFMKDVPEDLRLDAYFDLDRMDELAIDLRAHDHMHPVNKRTNYMFGEWDPHRIDNRGFYRRFILRKIIVDAMVSWLDTHQELPLEERLHDAAAVLCGTMLMASAISGAGPDTHSSDISLTSLLPKVARQRDAYYDRLLRSATGRRGQRLKRIATQTQQPFGHVRQHLNMYLAGYGAQQIQHRQLAYLYAKMGHAQAARQEAAIIPSASGRFECEIQWRITASRISLQQGNLAHGVELLSEVEELFDRGIQCGAFVDPWNVLGFQAQFPLFMAREDSVPDQRVDVLLDLKEQSFGLYSRAMCEAATRGERGLLEQLSNRFLKSAEDWDRYATPTVEDLLKVYGRDSWESASHVSTALTEWQQAGESAGDISFWSQHVERFQSAKAYSQVVDALLQAGDHVASMGLLMQWLSQAEDVGLENATHSINAHLIRWMQMVLHGSSDRIQLSDEERWNAVRRLFDYLEANAGPFWGVPELSSMVAGLDLQQTDDALSDMADEADEDDDDDDDEGGLFGAAYDEVVFQGSSDDGVDSDTLDTGFSHGNTEFEILNRQFEPRLRFLMTLAQLWQMAGAVFATKLVEEQAGEPRESVVREWHARVRTVKQQLRNLLSDVWLHDIDMTTGDLDANVEYDVQLQTKFFLQHTIIATSIGYEVAERTLGTCLAERDPDPAQVDTEMFVIGVYRGIFRRDAGEVMRYLPGLIKAISKEPLLYVPFDNGGNPEDVLRTRCLQTLIRFLLEQLPRLGLIRETFRLLKTAYRMERSSRPGGLAVTEFDRLFRTALRNSLLSIVRSAVAWDDGQFPAEQLVDAIGKVVEKYRRQWLQHSKTMRLSTVEELNDESVAEYTRQFIENYGADLFHARNLTLGNIRAILHHGVDTYLDYLEETQDPLQSMKLLDDLSEGDLAEDDAIESLELIYEIVVDKFDRFLEYNTTTTQSDYGERFYSLLDFLRIESTYDREAWELAPYRIAHQVLANEGLTQAAMMWEQRVATKTQRSANQHLKRLREMEQRYGMQLPSVFDHLNERFIKPLAVNRMLALVPQAREEAEKNIDPPKSFLELKREINAYLEDASGSGIDVPPWLRSLEKELTGIDLEGLQVDSEAEIPVDLPPLPLTRETVFSQLENWSDDDPSGGTIR